MEHIKIKYYKSPVGELIIGDYNNQLCLCDWKYRKLRPSIDSRIQKGLNATYVEECTALHKQTTIQLEEYFNKKRKRFDIPLQMVGTAFQIKVWNALIEISYGETLSYLGLSQQLGDAKAIRAVATANGANAISIIVPCHRIIGSKGELTGYAGGLPAKKKLLELEGSFPNSPQLKFF